MQKNLITKLENYKPLNQHEDVTEFVQLVREAVQTGETRYIPILLSFFSDESDFPDVMQYLLTELEEYSPKKYIPILMNSFQPMLVEAPQWLVTIVIRILNNATCLKLLEENLPHVPKKPFLQLLQLISQESPYHKKTCTVLKKKILKVSIHH